ncbi:MAG: acetolactate synthase large subunit [Robiginitomaculum sp.]|nr:acetolactate synthase large subunit [Robiginitomaculum sp.]
MNGAEALIQVLSDSGVEVCFANPGTSEMHMVAAIDGQPKMRAVLGLFEGVVTGAADGYGRMADKPAATLLHLGAGLGNGLANLHNARRAYSPVVNIVGDHATYHLDYDAPLTSDIAGVAAPMSNWVGTSTSPDDLAKKGAQAIEAAMVYPGQVATLIAPANHAWDTCKETAKPAKLSPPKPITKAALAKAVRALNKSGNTALFLGNRALREDALVQAGRIAAATGCRLLCETFQTRLQRGAGRVVLERLPYFGEMAADYIKDFDRIIFVGAKPPVSFFAYPDKPSFIPAAHTELVTLADVHRDAEDALRRLAGALDAPKEPANVQAPMLMPAEPGRLTAASVGAVVAELMPDNAIISDEAATSGLALFPLTAGAAKHDWLNLTGGSIGQGLPVGVGAAIACPDRKVICLQADGSAMYTLQALWTMARENLDVTTVILNNSSYAILNIELARVGVSNPGPKALSMLDLSNPTIDWVKLSEGQGVPAVRADTAEAFHKVLKDALAHKGPRLVEAIIPSPGG